MRRNPKGIHFSDLCKVCDSTFGEARHQSSSHRIYQTPWQGDPRINIQDDHGMAKAYQVRQVLKAIERLEAQSDVTE
ncbi:MAG: toxin HicA [Chloroflexota bacterium]